MERVANEESPAALPLLEGDRRARGEFSAFLKPRMAQLLAAFGLDIVFHRAHGDFLYYRDDKGREVEVLDFLGGFGASLFGHNHPELVAIAKQALTCERPFNSQASVRPYAASLAHALSDRVGRSTGRSYVVTLASTGTEAIEAAIKHAELEQHQRNERLAEFSGEEIRRLRIRLRDGSAYLPHDFLDRAAAVLESGPCASLDDVVERLAGRVREAVETEPRFLAIEGGFHGKTTGSLQLTYKEEFRQPWRRLGVHARFIPRDDVDAVEREASLARVAYPAIAYQHDGGVFLRQEHLVGLSACFCEPLQGEGGIHELGAAFVQALRRSADAHGFPLILDEIQSGMGRTGTFLGSEPLAVRGDYYLLSKSLGGGLAKISALLVDAERYQHEFGYLHTSTFADDDYSSAIALGALDLLERNGGALLSQCARKGDALLRRFRDLQRRFPGQVRDVRGRGLMIGVELAPQAGSASPLLRVLSEQHALAYLACGYLLSEHGVRVAPTLSERQVLRVEPSAYVSDESCDRLCVALEQCLSHLKSANVSALTACVVGRRASAAAAPLHGSPLAAPTVACAAGVDASTARVAFLVHFAAPEDLRNWDEGLRAFSDVDCAVFLDRTRELLRPFVSHRTLVRSTRGETVELIVIGVPFTAAQAVESMRQGTDWCLDMVKESVRMARELQCDVVGLGGHTSIVCNSGRGLVEDDITLTSGNSLTVAAAQDELLRAVRRVGRRLGECRLGVVGASGNVGATIAELSADDVGSIVLIGRPGAERFLRPVAERICAAAFDRVVSGQADSGIAQAIARSDVVQRALRSEAPVPSWNGNGLYGSLADEMGELAPVRISVSMQELRSCDIVVSATNASQPVVNATHLGERTLVVCDIAVPRDVDPGLLRDRPDVTLVKGGMIRAPAGQVVEIPGMRLRGGELYGCLAETILLGFVRRRGHYSYGPLSAARVREIREWAFHHGFEPVET